MGKFTIVKPAKGARDTFNANVQVNPHTGQRVGSVLASVGYKNFEGSKLSAILAFASQSFDVCYILANAGLQAYGKAEIDGADFARVYSEEVEKGKRWAESCHSKVKELVFRLSIINGIYGEKDLYSKAERRQFTHQCTFVLIRWEKWEAQETFNQREEIVRWVYQNPNKLLELSRAFKQRADTCGQSKEKKKLERISKILASAADFKTALDKSSEEYARRQGNVQFSKIYLMKESTAMSFWPRSTMVYLGGPTVVLRVTEKLCNAGFFEIVSLEDGNLLVNERFCFKQESRQYLHWVHLKAHEKEITDQRFVIDNFYHSRIRNGYEDVAFTNFPLEAYRHANRFIFLSDEKYYFEIEDPRLIEGKNLALLTKKEQKLLLEKASIALDAKTESRSPSNKKEPPRRETRSRSCPDIFGMTVFANAARRNDLRDSYAKNETTKNEHVHLKCN